MLCGQPSLLQRLLLFTVARLPLVTKPALSSHPGLCAILETAFFFLSPAFCLRRSLFNLLSGCVVLNSRDFSLLLASALQTLLDGSDLGLTSGFIQPAAFPTWNLGRHYHPKCVMLATPPLFLKSCSSSDVWFGF